MNKINLLKILHGDVDLIHKVNIEDIALYEDAIPVYPQNVKKMLNLRLSGNIDTDELSQWAQFLCARSEYTSPDSRDNDKSLYYEDMWYVIQKLSTPEIDGELTTERLEQYLNELKKYEEES